MKYLLMTLAVVMIFAAPALAADGNLSQSQMAKMGLSGMTVMSDAQGTAVRGMGFSLAFGASYAKVDSRTGDAATVNGYLAIDKSNGHRNDGQESRQSNGNSGGTLAGGANLSVAGTADISVDRHVDVGVKAVFAGGASIAFTK